MEDNALERYQHIMKIGYGGLSAVDEEILKEYGRNFKKGEYLIKEGDVNNDVFFILEGTVIVTKETNTSNKVLAVLGPGEMVGEMSFFESISRSASCIADQDVKTIFFNNETFSDIYRLHPRWLDQILKSLSVRIVKTFEVLKDRTA